MYDQEPNRTQLRIFISSPSDVKQERIMAQRVVERLAREFYHFFEVQPVLWEREPLVATEHFQTMITPPHETDIVVCILWSRLGVFLPEDQFRGAITGKKVTGTEWEFEDAVQSYRNRNTPDVLVYRKRKTVTASIDNPKELKEAVAQKELLEDFVQRWFIGEDQSFKVATHSFTSTTDFVEILETHLRELISKRLPTESPSGTMVHAIGWTQGSPYRGLATFEQEHTKIFFGRTHARNEVREALVKQAAGGKAFVLVLGASGSGKSSLIKAGLIPDVIIPGMAGRVGLMRWCLFRPSESQNDVIRGLASALFAETALPELRDVGQTPETLAAAFRKEPTLAVPSIRAALEKAAEAAQLTTVGEPRLLLVIDQLEEIFTLSAVDDATRESVATLLKVLANSGRVYEENGQISHGDLVWIVCTMRSDFYHRLEEIPGLVDLAEGEGQYHLLPPRPEELGQIIRNPAREAGLTFEVNAEGIGLDAVLQEAASHGIGVLPLLEFTLDELYAKSAGDRLLTYGAYHSLGGLQGSIGQRAEHVFQLLPTQVQHALPFVFRSLVTVDLGDDMTTAARAVPYDMVATTDERKAFVDALVQERLLVLEGRQEQPAIVRVAHEALLVHWPRVQKLIAADRDFLQARTRLLSSVELWRQEDCSPERLLPAGKPLAEAEDILEKRREELDPQIIDYIRASADVARQKERRRFRLVATAATVFAILSIAASIGGYIAYIQRQNARDQANLAMARQLASEAELKRQNPRALEETSLLALESLRQYQTIAGASVVQKVLQFLPKSDFNAVHEDAIRTTAISADGRYLATGDSHGRASVWDLGTRKEVLRVNHDKGIEIVSLHPQGKYLATGGRDGQTILWEIESGKELYRHQTGMIEREYTTIRESGIKKRSENAEVTALIFSKDCLATAGADGTLQLIDIQTRQPVLTQTLDSRISQVVHSPDGQRIAALSGRNVKLWEIASGQQLGIIQLDRAANDLHFDPQGRYIATAVSKTVTLWDVSSQKRIADFVHDKQVSQVRFQPNSPFLWSASADKTVRQWDLETKHEHRRIQNGDWVRILRVSGDGKYIATADYGDVARLWHTSDGSEVVRFSHDAQISALVFSPETDVLATASTDGMAKVWRLQGRYPVELEQAKDVGQLVFNEDGSLLVTTSAGLRAEASVWQMPQGYLMSSYTFTGIGNAATISPDGAYLIQTSKDTVVFRTIETGEVVSEIQLEGIDLSQERGYSIGNVAISRNGRWILKNINRIYRLWKISDRRAILRKTMPANTRMAAFSADSTRLITVTAISDSMKDLVEVHDLESGQKQASWVATDQIHLLTIGQDSRFIAVPKTTYTRGWTIWKGRTTFHLPSSSISIVNLTTGEMAAQVVFPNIAVPNRIETMAFSPDGKFLAAGFTDGTLSVVRVKDSEEVARLQQGRTITTIGFTPDQRYLVTAGKRDFVRLWLWRIDDLVTETCSRLMRNFKYSQWTKYFGEEPYELTCDNLPPHPSLLEQARLLAEMGDVDIARELLGNALRLGETIDMDADTWINKASAIGLIDRGVSLAEQGQVDEALAAYIKAQHLDSAVEISAKAWNVVCWQGALRQMPEKVMHACDRAVELAPELGGVYDSRGVVRALLGDYDGAIADFEVYLAWAADNNRSEKDINKRKQWIESLRRQQNPFDPKTLKRLQ